MSASITLHLPMYRDRSLRMQTDRREAEFAFDAQIGDYVEFLRTGAAQAGFELKTDQRDTDAAYSIEAADRETKKAAHDWLDTQPDIWNWMP